MLGFLNVNKPAGWTSRDVVNKLGGILRKTKLGHAGTLDPLATGVLIVAVGAATRLISLVQATEKTYLGRFRLSCRSDTDDITGTITQSAGHPPVAADDLRQLLPRFLGRIEQIPPAFSAVHVDGKRAYALARAGKEVTLQARTVDIHELELISFQYPDFELRVRCGSGTYIRSLGRDLGEALGCGAIMTDLVRTSSGTCHIDQAIAIDDLSPEKAAGRLIPPQKLLGHVPSLAVTDDESLALRQGKKLFVQSGTYDDQSQVALLKASGQLLGIGLWLAEENTIQPRLILPES